MAYGLLDGRDTVHLYRHDVESLFYIVLILAAHYEVEAPTEKQRGGLRMRRGLEKLPYQVWFDQSSYEILASLKHFFISDIQDLNLSPTFEDFRDWLTNIHASFALGFQAKRQHSLNQRTRQQLLRPGQAKGKVKPTAFDDETLGGYITYSTLIGSPTGKLTGLVIRYVPPVFD